MRPCPGPSAGLYVHIPFCESRSPCSDSYAKPVNHGDRERLVEALIAEITLRAAGAFHRFKYDTVFFGGGDPSLLSIAQIEKLITTIRANFTVIDEAEVTIECNPLSIDKQKLKRLLDLGFNRLSVSIGSFDDDCLRRLGKPYSSAKAIRSIKLAGSAGFDSINIDIAYGFPGQTLAQWQNDIRKAIELAPQHISAYEFTAKVNRSGGWQPGDTRAEMHTFLLRCLAEAGYRCYEICHFAKSGRECRYILNCYHGQGYLGLGPSAVSYNGSARLKNLPNFEKYITSLGNGKLPPHKAESLDREKRRDESIIAGLRVAEGIDLETLKSEFDFDLVERQAALVKSLLSCGYAILDKGHLKLTSNGMLLCDEITSRLLPA